MIDNAESISVEKQVHVAEFFNGMLLFPDLFVSSRLLLLYFDVVYCPSLYLSHNRCFLFT